MTLDKQSIRESVLRETSIIRDFWKIKTSKEWKIDTVDNVTDHQSSIPDFAGIVKCSELKYLNQYFSDGKSLLKVVEETAGIENKIPVELLDTVIKHLENLKFINSIFALAYSSLFTNGRQFIDECVEILESIDKNCLYNIQGWGKEIQDLFVNDKNILYLEKSYCFSKDLFDRLLIHKKHDQENFTIITNHLMEIQRNLQELIIEKWLHHVKDKIAKIEDAFIEAGLLRMAVERYD